MKVSLRFTITDPAGVPAGVLVKLLPPDVKTRPHGACLIAQIKKNRI